VVGISHLYWPAEIAISWTILTLLPVVVEVTSIVMKELERPLLVHEMIAEAHCCNAVIGVLI